MKKALWIGIAGTMGAITRTWLGLVIPSGSGFPIATFTVNIIGAFLLCLIATGALEKLNAKKDLQDALTTGFLGSFTTFSALSIETILLFENGQSMLAVVYIGISMIGGMVAGLIGFSVGRKLVKA